MASHADARFNRGRWLLRIEDLDPPRESKAAATTFPVVLDRYGFEWDGPILYQSTRGDAYAAALETLVDRGLAFECSCTIVATVADPTCCSPATNRNMRSGPTI